MRYFFAVLAFAVACSATKPPEGPGTEYPCGIRGISCGNHMCCWEGDVCGSEKPGSTCPDGMCCWVGSSDVFGAKKVKDRPQARDSK
jgi:hypothetical protein